MNSEMIVIYILLMVFKLCCGLEQCPFEMRNGQATQVCRRVFLNEQTRSDFSVICTQNRYHYGTNGQGLSFEYSTIEIISSALFHQCTYLLFLNLSDTNIRIIQTGAFNGLNNLRSLYLDRNKLLNVTRGTINSLSNLQFLNISQNRLNKIESQAFMGLISLQRLDLSQNFLENIDDQTFYSLTNLVYLDLSENKLFRLDCDIFLTLTSLQTLYLNNNQIVSLLNGENSTTQVHENALSGLTKLIELHLQYNDLKILPIGLFSDLKSLTFLDMSHNNISELHFGTFTGLNSLSVLKMSDNQLNLLYEHSFSSLTKLQILDISNNVIDSINAAELLSELPVLREINFDGNNVGNCFNLLQIIRQFKVRKVAVLNGPNTKQINNIYGIACTLEYPDNIDDKMINSVNSTKDMLRDAFLNSFFYKFFQNDFKNSEFYKFLNYLKEQTNMTTLDKHFTDYLATDKNYYNATFYKQIEMDKELLDDFKSYINIVHKTNDEGLENITTHFEYFFKQYLDKNQPHHELEQVNNDEDIKMLLEEVVSADRSIFIILLILLLLCVVVILFTLKSKIKMRFRRKIDNSIYPSDSVEPQIPLV